MTDKTETTVASSPAQATPKKQAAKARKPRDKPTHPPTSNMVLAAIKSLNERGGSSLQAIKKYIAATYKVDVDKQAPFIKKYLKNAADSGALVRTKGKGASGSFKLSASKGEAKPKKSAAKPKVAAKKPAAAKKPKVVKKPAEKKAAEAKKPVAAKKAAVAKQDKKQAAAKKPAAKKAAAKPAAKKSMAKKTVKSPAAKTKTPKAKKTATKAVAKKK